MDVYCQQELVTDSFKKFEINNFFQPTLSVLDSWVKFGLEVVKL